MFSKRERESGQKYPARLCSLSSGRLLSLTTLIVPRVDSSIHSFWSTRRTLALIKACREVSYWTRDCFLIPSTLTILVNRTPIQLPAWAFFFPTGFLLGLIFKVNAQMPRKVFFFSFYPPLPTHRSASLCLRLGSPCQEQHAWSRNDQWDAPPPVSQVWMTWEIFPSPARPPFQLLTSYISTPFLFSFYFYHENSENKGCLHL